MSNSKIIKLTRIIRKIIKTDAIENKQSRKKIQRIIIFDNKVKSGK